MSTIRFGMLCQPGQRPLPLTQVSVAGQRLSFAGRPGPRLRAAVERMERQQAEKEPPRG